MVSKGNKRHGSKPDRNRDNIRHFFKAILQTGSGCLAQGKLFSFYTGEVQAGSFLSTRACGDSSYSGENDTRLFFLTRSNSHPQAEMNSALVPTTGSSSPPPDIQASLSECEAGNFYGRCSLWSMSLRRGTADSSSEGSERHESCCSQAKTRHAGNSLGPSVNT